MFELGKNHKMPDEFVFENKYGKIIDYTIFNDGYLVIGFSEGYVVKVSIPIKDNSKLYVYFIRGGCTK